VFVPQDLEFMGVTVETLKSINPRLIPLIAHDRAGFGGGLASTGLAILLSVCCGLRPGLRGFWWVFLIAGLVGFATAIGIHPIVGYTSFFHLLPAYLGALAFLVGMAKLHGPVCGPGQESRSFPDF
jgi:dihydroorotate dehydrogenase